MTARIVTGGTFPAAAAWSPGQQALAGGQRGDSPVAACNAMRDSPMLKSRVSTLRLPGDLQAQAANRPAVGLRLHGRRGRPRCPLTAAFLGYNQLPSSRGCHVRRQCLGTRNSCSQPLREKKAASDTVYSHIHSSCLLKKSLRTSPGQERQAGSLHPMQLSRRGCSVAQCGKMSSS